MGASMKVIQMACFCLAVAMFLSGCGQDPVSEPPKPVSTEVEKKKASPPPAPVVRKQKPKRPRYEPASMKLVDIAGFKDLTALKFRNTTAKLIQDGDRQAVDLTYVSGKDWPCIRFEAGTVFSLKDFMDADMLAVTVSNREQ